MKQLLTVLCTLFFFTAQAQVWDKTLDDTLNIVHVAPTQDNGCILAGFAFTSLKNLTLIKVDASGKKEWKKNFTDVPVIETNFYAIKTKTIQDSDGNYWFSTVATNTAQTILMKLDKSGNRLLFRTLPIGNSDIHSIDAQIVLFGMTNPTFGTLLRLKNNGDTIEVKQVPSLQFRRSPEYVSLPLPLKNGLFVFNYSDSLPSHQSSRIKFDGSLQSRIGYPQTVFVSSYPMTNIIKTADGGYLIPDSSNTYKVDSIGRLLWRKNIGLGTPLQNSRYLKQLIAARNTGGDFLGILQTAGTQQINIRKYFTDGTLQSSNVLTYTGTFANLFLSKTIKGGYILAGQRTENNKVRLMKLDDNGDLYLNYIKGNIFSDRDINCRLSGSDIPIQRVMVVAKQTGLPDVLALTDTLGKYNLNVDVGTYALSIVNPNQYMEPCTPSVSKTITAVNKVDSADFALKSSISCAIMQVDVSTPRLRRCFNNNYTVSYCNKGTATATGAYVNVTLDSLLEFVSADKTVTSKTGRTYRFNLGDVPLNDCKTFDIVARVRCGDSTRLNQTLCVEAKIFPDTCGADNSLWSGANLTVSGSCILDTVVFQVRNTGRANAPATQATVIENLGARTVNIPALAPNSTFSQRFASNNNTWRMMVNQVANHPRSTQPTTFVEGCRRNSTTSFVTGFAAGFANDDAHSSIDLDCQPIIGAYDPNDKTGYPLGTGTTKAIGQNQDIEYIIRFQNTGTDTAFTVVIRDTLDIVNLDIKSIEWGTSSHKYVPEIYRENILKFTFDNILLVDSFKNEPASNGFVKFRIKQQKDVAFGTKIQNNAGIYFDFNDPVITNKTLHTVSKSVVSAIFDRDMSTYETIKVYPNPFTETAVFELENTPISISTFELYDVLGKRIIEQPFSGKIFQFQRENLTTGVYLFKIMNDNKILGVGKLMIQ